MVQPLRTLSRGLEVLRVLNRHNGAGLRVVAAASGLSRGAVHRLLETMVAEGYVRKVSGHYFVEPKVELLTAGVDPADWLTPEVQNTIQDLCRKLMWPISISRPNKLGMETIAATDHLTPLRYTVISVGTKLPMTTSAAGLVYLAFMPDQAQQQMIETLATEGEFAEDREFCRDASAAVELLRKIRSRGIAVAKARNRTAILAVPIMAGDTVLGALALRYFAAAMSEEEAISRNAARMRDAAAQIARGAMGVANGQAGGRPH